MFGCTAAIMPYTMLYLLDVDQAVQYRLLLQLLETNGPTQPHEAQAVGGSQAAAQQQQAGQVEGADLHEGAQSKTASVAEQTRLKFCKQTCTPPGKLGQINTDARAVQHHARNVAEADPTLAMSLPSCDTPKPTVPLSAPNTALRRAMTASEPEPVSSPSWSKKRLPSSTCRVEGVGDIRGYKMWGTQGGRKCGGAH